MAADRTSGYRERFLSAPDGLQLYFRDYGDPLSQATPLLCLSGLVRNSKDFHPLAERLAAERRIPTFAIRRPGNGASTSRRASGKPSTPGTRG